MLKIIKIITKLFIIILSLLILMEIIFSIYNKFFFSPIFYDKMYNRWRPKPLSIDYTFKLNSMGYKDKEFKRTKDKDIFRIIATGDSNAFGAVPYQYNFLTLLEESLNTKGNKVEVLNLGEPSIGPNDYLSILVHEALDMNPDLFLVCFTNTDDFSERKWYTYSYVASFIKYIIDSHTKFRGIIVHGEIQYIDNHPTFPVEYQVNYAKKKSDIFQKKWSAKTISNFNDVMYYLIKIDEICKKKNIPLVIAILHAEIQVNHSLQKKVIAACNGKPDDFDFSMPNRLLSNELNKHNIKNINLLNDFINATKDQGEQFYIPRNFHLNIAGNKIVAEILHKRLLEILNKK